MRHYFKNRYQDTWLDLSSELNAKPYHKKYLSVFTSKIPQGDALTLECGCGNGNYSQQFLQATVDAGKYYAMDINLPLLQNFRNASENVKLTNADIENLHIHDLRRTFGSWQTAGGSSIPIIGKSLGHKSQQATAIYARLDIDQVRHSVESAAQAMLLAGDTKLLSGDNT